MSAARRTRWGFHQLTDEWARRLVTDAHISNGDLVLDIGAGSGAITRPLAEAGARVIAFELHPTRVRELRSRFALVDRVKVVQADAGDLRLPRRSFHVVANPPFSITSGLLRRLLSPGSRLATATLVVPEHVARRWSGADAPAAGRWRRSFVASMTVAVPRQAFRPPPPGRVAVLHITRR